MSINQSLKPSVGLMLIATRKYKQFLWDIVDQAKKYFFPDHPVTIFTFTDEPFAIRGDHRVKIENFQIPPLQFPYATLYRYRIFDEHIHALSRMAYLFYSDVDMAFVDYITQDILCDGLTVVRHPGFYISNGWGSPNVDTRSTAFVDKRNRTGYVAGGFQGGRTYDFMAMSRKLQFNIEKDEELGIMAEYHDESHLNAYLKNEYKGLTLYLMPDYCMVEQTNLRKKWNINFLEPKVIALAKNHAEIRS